MELPAPSIKRYLDLPLHGLVHLSNLQNPAVSNPSLVKAARTRLVRFVGLPNSLDIYFNLANVDPVHRVIRARVFLEASAANCMHTVYQSLSDTESMLWSKFCELLNTRFGSTDPDAKIWKELQHLRQGF